MISPPVGEVCNHKSLVTPMQLSDYRLDDEGKWIYYHGFEIVKKELIVCGKPELWRWKYYLRYCGGCNKLFSNPWIPVCPPCAAKDTSHWYPTWDRVIQLDMRL